MESIKLNLIPGSFAPIVHVSQYDIGRRFRCYLFDGSSEYTLSNESITIYVRKPDGKLVTASVTVTSGNKYVDISTTQQMDAVAGKNICELKISKDGTVIGTCNFYMEVERDPTDGAIASESEIHDLQAQVDADVQEYLSHYASEAIGFDPTGTDLESTNVEAAIKEVNQKVDNIPDPTADNIEFDNDGTDLSSINVEDVIKEVNTKVNNLPTPMVYKGTVGDSGTVEWANLPAPSSSGQSKNVGFTYKVITDHGTAPICEEGDVIVSDGTEWTVVPSGDEPSGTVTNVATGVGLTGGPITSTGTIKANLRSETPLTRDSVAATEEADRVFAVVPDKSGKLSVVVPAGADIDDAHTSDRKTWSSEKIASELDKKADTEGVYDDLTAGSAKQLVSSVGEEDTSPYLFRTAGGSVDIGDRADVRALTGGTVAFNQLVKNGNFATNTDWSPYNSTKASVSIANNIMTITSLFEGNNYNNGAKQILSIMPVVGHKYILLAQIKPEIAGNYGFDFSGNTVGKVKTLVANTWNDLGVVTTASTATATCIIEPSGVAQTVGATIQVKNVNIIDLTQMFGSTIADYIYSLEQGTAGAGVAWVKKLFPKDYYAYNTGELVSVKTSAHITTGFNAYDNASGKAKVVGGCPYQVTGTYTSLTLNGESITPDTNGKFTPSVSGEITVVGGNATDTCIHLVWDGERDGEYEPYVKHEYPLDPNLELRGIPKLDSANKLVYDGDTYEPDGRVTRKYGVVDLGSLSWTYYGDSFQVFISSTISNAVYGNSGSISPILCPKYVASALHTSSSPDKTIYTRLSDSSVSVGIKDSAYSDAATFKTAMSGVYLVYELATPTTESAEPYTTPQVVDDWGTEEFVDNRTIPLLVGHDTVYQINLRAKLEMAPNSPDDEGDYLMRHVDGQNEYVPYVPVDISGKADTDGEYASLKAGNLVPTTYEEDEVPYLFRTSGGSIDIGESEEDTLVGGTVAFNQLGRENTVYTTFDPVTHLGTHTFDNTEGTSTSYHTVMNLKVINGHKYLFKGCKTFDGTGVVYCNLSGQNNIKNGGIFVASTDSNGASILMSTPAGTTLTATFYPCVFDITQMFGSMIADYIYSLEQGTAGAGVAWFRNLFPKDYYAYNAGELMSVKASKHIMTGFNQWDEEWESGFINSNGRKQNDSTSIRSKNFNRCLPNTSYYGKAPIISYMHFYDINQVWLGREPIYVNATGAIVSPSNAYYFKVSSYDYGTTYNHDICINLHWDGERNGEYEPYVKYEYPLDSDLELRGIPKLDANNKLYYDGDTYESDGTVKRKYGIVDLGTLNWRLDGDGGKFFDLSLPTALWGSGGVINLKAICSKYTNSIGYPINDKSWGASGGGYFEIYDTAFAGETAATFKTAMSGVYLVYELAEPTTEEADTFTNPQKVDDFGTEEYEDARTVPIPVGHYTKYPPNLRAKLEMAPDSPSGDGDYIVRQANGENSYVPLTKELPTPPSSNGTYVLKCTKSGSSVTYSWVAET